MTGLVTRMNDGLNGGYNTIQKGADWLDSKLTLESKGSGLVATSKGVWNGFYGYVRVLSVPALVACGGVYSLVPAIVASASVAFPPKLQKNKEGKAFPITTSQRVAMGLVVVDVALGILFPSFTATRYAAHCAAKVAVIGVSLLLNAAAIEARIHNVKKGVVNKPENMTLAILAMAGFVRTAMIALGY